MSKHIVKYVWLDTLDWRGVGFGAAPWSASLRWASRGTNRYRVDTDTYVPSARIILLRVRPLESHSTETFSVTTLRVLSSNSATKSSSADMSASSKKVWQRGGNSIAQSRHAVAMHALSRPPAAMRRLFRTTFSCRLRSKGRLTLPPSSAYTVRVPRGLKTEALRY